ncbi:MAG: hypothetical protein ABUK01_08720 [Leptospirales bacterium]
MGHEKLVEALQAETAETAEKIISDAKKKADDLIRNAAADAEKLREHKLGAIALEVERENTAQKNGLVSSLKGDLNSAKYSLMEETFSEVLLEIKNLPEEKYREALTVLFDSLLHHTRAYEKGNIYVDSNAAQIINSYATSKKVDLQKVEPPNNLSSGFLFISSDEKIKAESSFGSALQTLKPNLVIELKELLFGEL